MSIALVRLRLGKDGTIRVKCAMCVAPILT
jgi:hypothetical protein